MENAVSKILQRIQAIEARFSPRKPAGAASFQQTLRDELKPRRKAETAALALQGSAPVAPPGDVAAMLAASARKYGVDPKLADAVARTESNYSPTAVSAAGAVGVMQLMPDTAAALGVADVYDPRENIEGGVKYLGEMLGTFGGDVKKAVAAYNAGPQAVKNYGGVPPYAETQNYVRKVLDLYQ